MLNSVNKLLILSLIFKDVTCIYALNILKRKVNTNDITTASVLGDFRIDADVSDGDRIVTWFR